MPTPTAMSEKPNQHNTEDELAERTARLAMSDNREVDAQSTEQYEIDEDDVQMEDAELAEDVEILADDVSEGGTPIAGEQQDFPDDSIQGFFEHTDAVFTVAFRQATGEEPLVVSGGGDDTAFVWNPSTGERKFKFDGHTDSVIGAEFNFDGKLVATASLDGTIRVWSVSSGQHIGTLEGPSQGIEWFQWHPRGNVILCGSEDGTAWMWMAPSPLPSGRFSEGKFMQVFTGHSGSVSTGGYTTDGKRVVTGGGADGTIRVWNPKTGACAHSLSGYGFHDPGAGVVAMAFSESDPSLVLTGSVDTNAVLVNVATGKSLAIFRGHTQSVEAVGFCRGHASLPLAATGSLDGSLKIWDLTTGQLRMTYAAAIAPSEDPETSASATPPVGSTPAVEGHEAGIVKLMWHPTQPLIVTASMDATLRLWDGRVEKCVQVWSGHSDAVLDFDISADGTRIVSGSDDKTALVFDLSL